MNVQDHVWSCLTMINPSSQEAELVKSSHIWSYLEANYIHAHGWSTHVLACSNLTYLWSILPRREHVLGSQLNLFSINYVQTYSQTQPLLQTFQFSTVPPNCWWCFSLQLFLHDRWSCFCWPSHLLTTQPWHTNCPY